MHDSYGGSMNVVRRPLSEEPAASRSGPLPLLADPTFSRSDSLARQHPGRRRGLGKRFRSFSPGGIEGDLEGLSRQLRSYDMKFSPCLSPTLQLLSLEADDLLRIGSERRLKHSFFGRVLEETGDGLVALVTSKEEPGDEYIVTIPPHLVPAGPVLAVDSEFDLTVLLADRDQPDESPRVEVKPLVTPDVPRLTAEQLAKAREKAAEIASSAEAEDDRLDNRSFYPDDPSS